MAARPLVTDDHRRAPRHADLDLDLVDLGPVSRALGDLDRNAAACHLREVLLELGHFLAHALLDRIALLDAVELHLDLVGHSNCPFP
jgi:hypothetical protein